MRKKIILRTCRKIGGFFGTVIGASALGYLSIYIGITFFGDALIGLLLIFGLLGLLAVMYFAYKDAKMEVEIENRELMRELTKNG